MLTRKLRKVLARDSSHGRLLTQAVVTASLLAGCGASTTATGTPPRAATTSGPPTRGPSAAQLSVLDQKCAAAVPQSLPKPVNSPSHSDFAHYETAANAVSAAMTATFLQWRKTYRIQLGRKLPVVSYVAEAADDFKAAASHPTGNKEAAHRFTLATVALLAAQVDAFYAHLPACSEAMKRFASISGGT